MIDGVGEEKVTSLVHPSPRSTLPLVSFDRFLRSLLSWTHGTSGTRDVRV